MVAYNEDRKNVYESKRLNHLGPVAGMFEEMGLGEAVDAALGRESSSGLGPEICLKTMIINGLGFTTRPLYLSASFYETKAVEQLLGSGIAASDITDQRLDEFLEACYDYGCTKLFSQTAWGVFERFELGERSALSILIPRALAYMESRSMAKMR